uniref:ARC6 IMS domain-containing protein n=1 Tax=Kalanchoe fedtschenkoi TaxID=63787 RepID=A0A7N0V436_KALFE
MASLKLSPFFSLRQPKPFSPLPILKKTTTISAASSSSSITGANSTFPGSKWADRLLGDFHFLPATPIPDISDPNSPSSAATLPPLAPPDRYVSLPLDFYQVLGAESHFLGDGIRRAYEARVSKPPQYGFSQDALISRRQILQAACETLADAKSRRDYNQGLVDAPEDTILTDVPFEKVPGALCVLQEAGEAEITLQIGEGLLRERLPKLFKQDVVLAMALAYVDMSRDAMSLSPPDIIRGCEVLERALKLLQEEGASSLAPDLQAQIDETLEEITPRCVLELLALPLDFEFKTEREEGLQGLRNILWAVGGGGAAAVAGGFTREDYMNEAFLRMTASEQVDLFVATPSNIPAESFEVYGVALALVAQAFIGKKPHLIKDADNLFQQLQQTKVTAVGNSISVYTPTQTREVDFALERGLCSLLVGELDECRSWLGLDNVTSPYRDPSIVEFVLENSKEDADDDQLPGLCKLLEAWLMEVVFPRFRDTNDLRFKLGDYYDDPTVLKYLERLEGVGGSPLAAAAAIVKIGAEATAVLDSVKASALEALRKVFPPSQGKESLIRHEDTAFSNSASAEEREQFYESVVNDGQMLQIWKDRAAEIANHGWFWEYKLLNLTIESLTVKLDGRRATVEATIEESASLTDLAHPENNNSYNKSYTTRYELSHSPSGWKITEGAVLRS